MVRFRHKKHHKLRVGFTVKDVSVILNPQETAHMATTLTLGQSLPLSIAFLDQNGQPMAPTPAPDSPPAWTSSGNDLTVAPDGLSAVLKPTAAGADTVTLSVTVGGKTFSATLAVTVAPIPQVLTSVEIVAGTPA